MSVYKTPPNTACTGQAGIRRRFQAFRVCVASSLYCSQTLFPAARAAESAQLDAVNVADRPQPGCGPMRALEPTRQAK
jgi:hypothetical protein